MPRPEPRPAPRSELRPAPAGSTDAATGKSKTLKDEAIEWTKSLGVAVVLFIIIRTFLVQAFSIPSESMEKTLLVGDYLMASNVVFGPHIPFTNTHIPGLREPRHGDIVVFRPDYNEPEMDVVKRLIGEPGDTVQMIAHQMYRNGKKLDEPYVQFDGTPDQAIAEVGVAGQVPPEVKPDRLGYHWHIAALPRTIDPKSYHPTRDNWGPLVVPPGHYFLMGDNRDESLDSRFMGFIPREQIRGKPMFIYFSYDPKEDAPFPQPITAARWSRLGTVIH